METEANVLGWEYLLMETEANVLGRGSFEWKLKQT